MSSSHEEITQLLPELDCRLISTSINSFKSIEEQQNIFEEEKRWHKVAEQRLHEKDIPLGFLFFSFNKGLMYAYILRAIKAGTNIDRSRALTQSVLQKSGSGSQLTQFASLDRLQA